jgi:hypothetical protein
MTRLSKILFAATALVAAPLSTAFAEEEGGSSALLGGGAAAIDRPLTPAGGGLGVGADLLLTHSSFSASSGGVSVTQTSTTENLGLSAQYGVTDMIAVGGSYGFSLHNPNGFEIKGPLSLYASASLLHTDKLDVGASVGVVLDFNGVDLMTGGSRTDATLDIGLGAHYKIAPMFEVFTGSSRAGMFTPVPGLILPTMGGPGMLGDHVKIGLNSGAPKTLGIPLGVGLQAIPQLFAYVSTNIADISLSDPGMDKRVRSIADATPLSLGASFTVTKNIGAVAGFNIIDLQHASNLWALTLGARYSM